MRGLACSFDAKDRRAALKIRRDWRQAVSILNNELGPLSSADRAHHRDELAFELAKQFAN
jgi:hypothetical protein